VERGLEVREKVTLVSCDHGNDIVEIGKPLTRLSVTVRSLDASVKSAKGESEEVSCAGAAQQSVREVSDESPSKCDGVRTDRSWP